jgi:hypothetical protein
LGHRGTLRGRVVAAVILTCTHLSACASHVVPPIHEDPFAARSEPAPPSHSLEAFGGRILGYDEGEWGGELLFQDASGAIRILVKENVRAIVDTPSGIFVFTGLAHLYLDQGALYQVQRSSSGGIELVWIRRLAGSPSEIVEQADGSVRFKTATDEFVETPNGMVSVHECFVLDARKKVRHVSCETWKR